MILQNNVTFSYLKDKSFTSEEFCRKFDREALVNIFDPPPSKKSNIARAHMSNRYVNEENWNKIAILLMHIAPVL